MILVHSFHYQDDTGRKCVPWCVEVRGTITHAGRFDGEVSIIHEDVEGEYFTLRFAEEDCKRVYDDLIYNMWGFNSEFYDFDFNREDARKIRLWLLELGFML